ncbi:hypothetical protein C6Y45_13055 [Alkalicoccus saliphilus]|uniref:Uncharacterized protein n=1 Tax=Alkalicoccus saliphilus TaxID=200989 RepID=A0A2T4U3Y7_9BACI|nr:hypothetical protein C6Y45_13055 [Alkalicoccus saliphilus]
MPMRYARMQGHHPLPLKIVRLKKAAFPQKVKGIGNKNGARVRIERGLSTVHVNREMSASEYQSIYAGMRRRHRKALDKLSKT